MEGNRPPIVIPGLSTLIGLSTFLLTILILRWGKPILMPVALAILLTFLLAPLVKSLRRLKISQPLAVIIAACFVFSVLTGLLWTLGHEMTRLASGLPEYKGNIRQKIEDLDLASRGSPVQKVRRILQELRGDLKSKTANSERSAHVSEPVPKPVPVVVQNENPLDNWVVPSALGSFIDVVGTGALVLVLVIFMLLHRLELRNRLIRLAGSERLPTMTHALDEAGARISRYLLMQTMVNTSYGVVVGIALFVIGLPYALLWAFMAGLLRFIPYVGAWLGAIFPLALALASFPGWYSVVLVAGVFVVLETVNNMLVEPLLYGHSAGVSQVALLIAVAFWTWIWGPIGLALATPLTVCVVVLGKYVPAIAFLHVLMGDEPVLEERLIFYQRLLAHDEAEVGEIVTNRLRKQKFVQVYDDLVIPALITAKLDHHRNELSENAHMRIIAHIRRLIPESGPVESETSSDPLIIGVASSDHSDEVALQMLAQVLAARGIPLQILRANQLDSAPDPAISPIFCVVSTAPSSPRKSKLVCRELRKKAPGAKIYLIRLGTQFAAEQISDLLSEIDGLEGTLEAAEKTLEETVSNRVPRKHLPQSGNPTDQAAGLAVIIP
jgi:predicted PurR-regulated permease PerM